MAKDVGTVIGRAVGHAARDATKQVAKNASANLRERNGSLNGTAKGVAAGVGIAALAPLAGTVAGRLAKKQLVDRPAKKVGEKVEGAKGAVAEKLGELVGDGGPLSDLGTTRRMPVQQAADVSLPISTVYNQWTQFEEWPEFMHRLDRVSQEDESHVSFKTKIWGLSKEFQAEIVEQRPDELIRWRVTDGVTHEGVVSFHELAPRLTRVDVDLYVQPGSPIEKAARGMRHVKRAVRADLARFKAFAELRQEESGEWRGAIEDAKVKSSRSGSSKRSRSSAKSPRGTKSSSSGRRSSSGARSSRSSNGRSSRASNARARSGSKRTRGATNDGSRSGSSRSGSQRRTRARS